jgi:hypothetical protein
MKPEHLLMGYLAYRVLHFFFWVVKEELRELHERREHPALHPPSSIAE